MAPPNELGPLVRLWGLRTQQLPSPTEEADELAPFLVSILQEAVPFIDSAAPKSSSSSSSSSTQKLWKPKGTKSHADSTAKVEVSERVIPAAELELVAARNASDNNGNKVDAEMWCCRRSVHEDAARKGTASWDEFDRSFRLHHAASEKAFTPNVLEAHEALRWNTLGIEANEGGETWGDFGLVVEEMRHKVGRPILKDRTFPVLQMTCAAKNKNEFLVVSIPVPDFGGAEASRLAKEKGAQIAFYASVERFRRLGDGSIEWLMATASDAAGVIPVWVQNKAMPGVVWKDVPLFLGWIAREREKEKGAKGEGAADGAAGNAAASGAPQVSTGVNMDKMGEVSTGAGAGGE
ncbi:Uu.00g038890.m01.CDS01 [Anthostomella pinea]|uniref:Uu.00g038890.m01.CDS01 n=1 Tax=Anthostomella pinea TaxID=933095 RepID=A0AAI8V9X7_9PEZI|nr:Uu.00g038890.m01.CDS01 [Anthostomella pinea]